MDVSEKYIEDAYRYCLSYNQRNFTEILAKEIILADSKGYDTYNKRIIKDIHNESFDSQTLNQYIETLDNIFYGIVGKYTDNTGNWGIKAFHPIPQGFNYIHVNNYKNRDDYRDLTMNEGNDFIAPMGTPIINIEAGEIEKIGWLDTGGWSIGIRSIDKKRYFYYGHMQKYAQGIYSGQMVAAGQLIGYIGDTGYGPEGTRGKIEPHLHLQIKVKYNIEGEEQSMLINPYYLIKFLEQNKNL